MINALLLPVALLITASATTSARAAEVSRTCELSEVSAWWRESISSRISSPSAEFGTIPTASTTRSASISTLSPSMLLATWTVNLPLASTFSTSPRVIIAAASFWAERKKYSIWPGARMSL